MPLPSGHVVTADEFALTEPIKGVLVTNSGNPIGTTSGTTEMDLAKLQLTGLSLTSGRYYRAKYLVVWTKTVSGDDFVYRLRSGTAVTGTQIQQSYGIPVTSGTVGYNHLEFVFKAGAAISGLFLSVFRNSGTGTMSYFGSTGGFPRGWASLEDMGDSGTWSDVA